MFETYEITKEKWKTLVKVLSDKFGIEPDLQAVLFLIGVQELGAGPINYSRFEKQDLIHVAVCKLLSSAGYYELKYTDNEGWPHYDHIKQIPQMKLGEQDLLLKEMAIKYFNALDLI
ncbi:MAG TPA: hypothetical protein PKH65_00095 [Bacteroidia bacterium]|nr:hypothetical protein [Bacteroidia bacterium]HNT79053.1 hypothetical protein [Bacteroidia bacterium]